jgi:SAM-dependent methyltransferase
MFNGLINMHDVVAMADKIRERGARGLVAAMAGGRRGRIEGTWAHHTSPPRSWWDIEPVRRRWNAMITGDPDIDPHSYVAAKYLRNGGLRGISLGCGAGARELAWGATGSLARLDAYDISASRVAHARRRAREERLDHIVRFSCADVFDLEIEPGSCDVVFAESALHHLTPLRGMMERIGSWLKPGGLFIVNEYIGPARFQWSPRQMEAVEGMLALMPHRYRIAWERGALKSCAYRPGRLSLALADPSEAAESDQIVELLPRMFRVRETAMYGGGLLHLLFKDIAHNFQADDEETRELLRLCFEVEDLLMKWGEIESDFGYFICTRRQPP